MTESMAKETALTLQPAAPPLPTLPISGETAGILGGGVMALVGAILWLRRRTSRDGVELIKDRTEGQLLNTLREERNEMMKTAQVAWSRATADAGTIAQLRAENEYLKRELTDARHQVAAIRQGVQEVGRQVDAAQSTLVTVEKRVGATSPSPLGRE